MSLLPKSPRHATSVHGLLLLAIGFIIFEIVASGLVYIRQWCGSPSPEKGECVYQVFKGEECTATLFLQRPQTMATLLKSAGILHGITCRDCSEHVPCGMRILLIGDPPIPLVDKIPGRQLVTAGQRINLNSADEADLTALPGLGPVTARKIIEYRETYGPFPTVEELKKIRGIGTRKLQSWQPHLETGPSGFVRRSKDLQAAGTLLDPPIRGEEDEVQHHPQIPY